MREIKFRAWHTEKKRMFPPWSIWKSNLHGYDDSCCLNLMQYTGLKDKNGKEIYEGDVIEGNLIKYSPLPTMGTIVWDKEFASFANQNEAGNTLLFEIDRIKIIGNIYENPELKGVG